MGYGSRALGSGGPVYIPGNSAERGGLEVMAIDELMEAGTVAAMKEKGRWRQEGKGYLDVQSWKVSLATNTRLSMGLGMVP